MVVARSEATDLLDSVDGPFDQLATPVRVPLDQMLIASIVTILDHGMSDGMGSQGAASQFELSISA